MYKVKMPIGVTFICQILLGLRPWVLTSSYGSGRCCAQVLQVLTIYQTCSLGRWNCL
jgi:hypothetical protein